MEEKKQKDQDRKNKEKEEEIDAMKNYSKFYKFGKQLPGGGNPLRNYTSDVETEAG